MQKETIFHVRYPPSILVKDSTPCWMHQAEVLLKSAMCEIPTIVTSLFMGNKTKQNKKTTLNSLACYSKKKTYDVLLLSACFESLLSLNTSFLSIVYMFSHLHIGNIIRLYFFNLKNIVYKENWGKYAIKFESFTRSSILNNKFRWKHISAWYMLNAEGQIMCFLVK